MTNVKTILIIEDDEVDRKVLCRYLKSERPDTDIVESHKCEEGFSAMKEKDFDCILLDYQLPDGDGIEFLQKMMLGEFKCPPVLFLTGQGDELLAVEALRSGAADYIPKENLSANRLNRSIDNAIRFHQLEARAKDAETKLVTSVPSG